MTENTNGNIYKLIVDKKISHDKYIDQIVRTYNLTIKENYKSVDLNINSEYGYKYKLFTLVSIGEPQWVKFLNSISLKNNDDIKSINSSYLLFIYDQNDIFVLAKGHHGHHAINKYYDPEFGINILSRLVKKDSTIIRAINERKIFGSEFSAIRNFKGEFNLTYDDNFGKIYNNILAEIEDTEFHRLGIIKKKQNIKSISVDGGAAFAISSSFNFNELDGRIYSIQALIKDNSLIENLNYFVRINKFKLSEINDQLSDKLWLHIYNNTFIKKHTSFDFIYKNIDMYLNSKSLSIIDQKTGDCLGENIESVSSFSYKDLINILIANNIISNDVDITEFRKILSNIIIQLHLESNNSNEIFTYETYIHEWISAEITIKGVKYFKIDGIWYTYQNTFKKYLDRQINESVFSQINQLNKWSKTKNGKNKLTYIENHYNESHKNKENQFIVCDATFIDYIEIADIIRIDDAKKTIELIHVKKGIGRDLRVLSSQILNSARLLRNLEKAKLKQYFLEISNKYYNSKDITVMQNSQLKSITQEQFLKYFEEYSLDFIMAFSSNKKESVKNLLSKSKSLVGKIAFLYNIKELHGLGYKLNVELIEEV